MTKLSEFFQGKKIFLTGHTGFKGSWLTLWLSIMGAKTCGYALAPEEESLYSILDLKKNLEKSIFGDIRNEELIEKSMQDFQPDIIIHMAAQPLVRASYFDPRFTYETNVIGALNVFEAARKTTSVKAVVNVTTDKCYANQEIDYAYKEGDKLGGHDPYSSSKACSEILTESYRQSFFSKAGIHLASARAGNVIGGGDFSVDRIIPDIFRAIRDKKPVEIRSPNAIRPWQHVLEPLHGYLLLAKNLYEDGEKFAKAYNFGPEKSAEISVRELTDCFIKQIGFGNFVINENRNLHEAGILKLNNSLSKAELGWKPKLSFLESISFTASWYKNYFENRQKIEDYTLLQIKDFLKNDS